MINIRLEAEQLGQKLSFSQAQVRKLTAVTLTKAAYNIQAEVQAEMRRVFRDPTEFVLRSVYVRQSKVQGNDVTPAIIGIRGNGKVSPAHVLFANTAGGPRRDKRSEDAMARIMPDGFNQWVPGARAPLNANHDIPGPYMRRMLSALQALEYEGYNSRSLIKGSTGLTRSDLRRASKVERDTRDGVRFNRRGQIQQGIRGYSTSAREYLLQRQAAKGGANFFVGNAKGGRLEKRIVYQFDWSQQAGKRTPNNPNPEPVLVKRNLRPVLVFTKTQNYKQRLLIGDLAQRVAAQDIRSIAQAEALRLFARWNAGK